MEIEVFADAAAVAKKAAEFVANAARIAIEARGKFLFAVSGGKTPWMMLSALAKEQLPWSQIHLIQVDERIAPAGDPDRNLTQMNESLLSRVPIPAANVHAMPVETADLGSAAKSYAHSLGQIAGHPCVIDLVHLGLGADGHTASLVPNDESLTINDADIAITGEYQGRRRMTLTYPIINRARHILWLVTGSEKAERLVQLRDADPSIPAGRVNQVHAVCLADQVAASQL